MPGNHPHIALPLEALIARLEAAGFRMDTARKMRLFRVLEQEGPEVVGNFEEMKYRLAPFIARTPQEQERFYHFFDQFVAECMAEATQLNQAAELPGTTSITAPPGRKVSKWWLLLLLPVGLLVWWYVWQTRVLDEPAGCSIDIQYNPQERLKEGDTLVCRSYSSCPPTTDYIWEIRDSVTGQLIYADTSEHLQWRATGAGRYLKLTMRHLHPPKGLLTPTATENLQVYCANPPKLLSWQTPKGALRAGQSYEFTADVEKGAEVEWTFSDTVVLTGARVRHAFSREGETTVTLQVYRPGQKNYCFTWEYESLTIGGKPYLQTFAATRDFPRLLRQLNGWYWLFATLPLLLAFWLLARWWKKRQEKTPEKTVADLEAEYPIHDVGPYFIPYLPQEGKITVPRDFFRIAEVLRRRELGVRRYFDATASVRATVDAGGYPEWREKSDTRPAEYLFLVERPDERNQQSRLFERLTAFLKRREAPIEVFFHSGSFDVFKNPEHPNGLGLTALKQFYPAHRLVLLGNAHGLVNPYASETPALLSDPVKILRQWPRRLLLTPETVRGWSFQEALLHRHFLICPADTEGLLAGLDQLDRMEEYEPGNYARWEADLLRLHPQNSHRYQRWETPEDHKKYLEDNPNWYRWLCALAVCVQPDWALTIAIGRAIGVEVTHDGLLALSRIPWLSNNAPDTGLRLAFLRELDRKDEALARQVVAIELENVRDRVTGSFAETDWKTNQAVQQFALDPLDENHKQTLRDLKRLGLLSGDQLAELDLIVQEKTDRKNLPARAIENLNAWLEQPAPKSLWTKELWGGLLVMSLSAFLIAYGIYYNRTRAAQPFAIEDVDHAQFFWLSMKPLDDQAVAWNNEAVNLWLQHSEGQAPSSKSLDGKSKGFADRNPTEIPAIIDSLLDLAIRLRLPDLYALADSNRIALRFNFAANWFESAMDALSMPDDSAQLKILQREFGQLVRPQALYDYPTAAFTDQSSLCLAALHGRGLCDYYLGRRDSALISYNRLLALTDSFYFDTLSMPVNLKTLLDIEKQEAPPITKKTQTAEKEKKQKAPPKPQGAKGQLASGTPSKDLIMKALEGFRFGAYSGATEEEARSILEWLGASDIKRRQTRSGLQISGRLKSGFFLGLWLEVVGGKDDRYSMTYGKDENPALRAEPTAFELVRYARSRIPVPIPVMVRVPGGTFIMGCQDEKRDGDCDDNEKPPHEVTLSDFAIGKYEVTNEEFAVFLNDYGSTKVKSGPNQGQEMIGEYESGIAIRSKGDLSTQSFELQKGYEKYPVFHVTWYGATEYTRWLSEKTNQNFRLPTEAEWEYAARGGQQGLQYNFLYSGSNNPDEVAWYRNNTFEAQPVGRKKANSLGLFDMSGNVWEWCADYWYDNYEGAPTDGSAWVTGKSSDRVYRGGSYREILTSARCASRFSFVPGPRSIAIGFRLGRTAR